MSRFYWIFGLITGLVYVALDYSYHQGLIGHEKYGLIFIIQMGIFVLSVVFASIGFKKVNGAISFMRTVFGAVMVGLIASVIIISGRMVLSSAIDNYTESTKSYEFQLAYNGQPEDQRSEQWVNDTRLQIENKYSLGNLIQVTLVGYLFFGAIIGAFTAAFIANRSTLE